jgi:putative membrane protein
MNLLVRVLLSGLAVFVTSYLLPGVIVSNFLTAVVVGIVLGIINAFVKPVLVILTLPITLVTLGLFYFILNALLILFVAQIVPGFVVESFWWALAFGLVMSIVSWFFNSLTGNK